MKKNNFFLLIGLFLTAVQSFSDGLVRPDIIAGVHSDPGKTHEVFRFIEKKELTAEKLCSYIVSNITPEARIKLSNSYNEPMYYTALRVQNFSALKCLESLDLDPKDPKEINAREYYKKNAVRVNYSPYEYAIMYMPVSFIQEFERKGGKISPESNSTGPHLAAFGNTVDVLDYFIKRTPDFDVNSWAAIGPSRNVTLLAAAAITNSRPEVLAYILNMKPNLELISDTAYMNGSALTLASAFNQNVKIHTLLINAGAKINAVHERKTPLLVAAYRNPNIEVHKLLLSKGANINFIGFIGPMSFSIPPVFASIAGNSLDITTYLLSKGANPHYSVEAPNGVVYDFMMMLHDFKEMPINELFGWFEKFQKLGGLSLNKNMIGTELAQYVIRRFFKSTREENLVSLEKLLAFGIDFTFTTDDDLYGSPIKSLYYYTFIDRDAAKNQNFFTKDDFKNLVSRLNINLNQLFGKKITFDFCDADIQEIQWMENNFKIDFSIHDSSSITSNCLFVAARYNQYSSANQTDKIYFWANKKIINPNAVNKDGDTLITAYVRSVNFISHAYDQEFHKRMRLIIKALIDIKVKLNIKSKDGETAYSLAVKNNAPKETIAMLKP